MGPCVKMQIPLGLVLLLVLLGSAAAQVTVTITTFGPQTTDGSPNTVLGTGSQIASSLLGSSVPAILYGVVASSDVNAICTNIVNTGSLSFSADIAASGVATETRQLTVTHLGGCLAATDGSGTEAVMVDDTSRASALVCPNNAGTAGCAVYFTGDDVTALYNQGARRRLMAAPAHNTTGVYITGDDGTNTTGFTAKNVTNTTGVYFIGDDVSALYSEGEGRLLQSCGSGAASGAIQGAITGVMGVTSCVLLGPLLGAFCAIGMIGASTALNAVAGCASNCFPGDAVVTLASGETKTMAMLALGDKVAVKRNELGTVAYEDVYAFGHKDATAKAIYVRLTLANAIATGGGTRTLELTSLHFAPVVAAGLKVLYKRAEDIEIGDQMWAQADAEEKHTIVAVYVVHRIDTVVKQGVYNPFTLGGTIIVNGVVASSHSDWFLDPVFEAMGVTHWLPSAYQLILLPVRVLYKVVGKDVYIGMYEYLDSLINIAHFGTYHGAQFAVTITTLSGAAIMVALSILHNASPR